MGGAKNGTTQIIRAGATCLFPTPGRLQALALDQDH